jgi:hypothetical protein
MGNKCATTAILVGRRKEDRCRRPAAAAVVTQGMPDDEFAVWLRLVAEWLAVTDIARLLRTCRLARRVLDTDDVWCAVFMRMCGSSGDSLSTTAVPQLTWKKRVRWLLETVRVDGVMPFGTVFSYGNWYVVSTGAKVWFISRTYVELRKAQRDDVALSLEFVEMSNSWFRARLGDCSSWIMWPQLLRSRSEIGDGWSLNLVRGMPPERVRRLRPGSFVQHDHATITFLEDRIEAQFLPTAIAPNLAVIDCTSGHVTFAGIPIADLAFR